MEWLYWKKGCIIEITDGTFWLQSVNGNRDWHGRNIIHDG